MSQNSLTMLDPTVIQLASRFLEPGMQIRCATTVATPVKVYKVICDVVEARRMGMIEEFVLRAAIHIDPPLHWQQLAEILRIDMRFVADTREQLQKKGALQQSDWLQITEQGNHFYADGMISSQPTKATWYLLELPIIDRFIALKDHRNIKHSTEFPVVAGNEQLDATSLKLEDLISIADDSEVSYHNSEQQITACDLIEPIESGFLEWDICVTYDWLNHQSTQHVVRPPSQYKFSALDLQTFLRNLAQTETFQMLQSPPVARKVQHVAPEWRIVSEQINQLYATEMRLAREHVDSELTDSVIYRVDHHDLREVLEDISEKASSSVVIVVEEGLFEDPGFFPFWTESLSSRSVSTLLLVRPNVHIDAGYVEQLIAVSVSEGNAPIKILRTDENLSFFALVDSKYIFVPIQQVSDSDQSITLYPHAVLMTDNQDNLQKVLEIVLPIVNGDRTQPFE